MSAVSILAPMRHASAPPQRKRVKLAQEALRPDPHATLGALGTQTIRTTSALGELAVMTQHLPETWQLQVDVANCACHELLAARDHAFRKGIEHGKWLHAHELQDSRRDLDKMTALEAKSQELQMQLAVLNGKYDQAKAALLEHISKQSTDNA